MKFLSIKSKVSFLLYVLLYIVCYCLPTRLQAETITIASGEYPPWTSQKLKGGGYLNLLVSEAFKLHDIEVKYDYMPWKRALESTRIGKYHASSFWGANKERNKEFLQSQSIENIYFVFFYNKKRFNPSMAWKQLSDLEAYRIGATRGYTYNEEFWALYHANKLRVSLANDDIESLRKLISGKIDLFPISEFTGKYLLHRNFSPSEIKSIGFDHKPLSEGKNFILFSKAHTENTRYLRLLNEGLNTLRKAGKLKQLKEDMFK